MEDYFRRYTLAITLHWMDNLYLNQRFAGVCFFHLFVQHELFRGFAVNNFYLIHEGKMIFEVS